MKRASVLSLPAFLVCFCLSASAKASVIPFIYSDTTSSINAIPAPQELLNQIISVTGIQQNIELKEADVMNLEANIQHKKRYILYNAGFISQLNTVAKNKWATTALLAHELGHHLNGHTLKTTGSNKEVELEADEYAGFVLQKMGATLAQAQEVMYYIAKTEDTPTHPGRGARLKAIAKGYNRALGN